MAREVVLDANVIVAWLDAADVLAPRAAELLPRLNGEGADLVLLDFLVGEAVSVLCRRATQRKAAPPDLQRALDEVRAWASAARIRAISPEASTVGAILDVIASTGGTLNYNDALLVVLQRQGVIGDVASFDAGFDTVPEFVRAS